MQLNRKHNIYGWLTAAALLLTTACAENDLLEAQQADNSSREGVTFTILPQVQVASTRTGEGEEGAEESKEIFKKTISDGKKANKLVYAVYEVNKDEKGNILSRTLANEFIKNATVLEGGELSTNSNSISVDKFPVSLNFLFSDSTKTYQVAFWAQSKETEAYDTKDLTKVKVNYAGALNNDELRDAFCAVSSEISAYTKQTEQITLRRPLSQVNVGTAGWDYEGAGILHPDAALYTQSKITFKGVAQYYNVLEKRALSKDDLTSEDGDATTNITYDFGRIPALYRFTQQEFEEYKKALDPQLVTTNRDGKVENEPLDAILRDLRDKEEILEVNLDENKDIEDYKGWYDYDQAYYEDAENKGGNENPATERFKYLSMSYILVPEAPKAEENTDTPSATEESNATNPDAVSNPSTIEVEFEITGVDGNEEWRKEDDNYTGKDKDGNDYDYKSETYGSVTFNINNVPVQKNWRTNIIGYDMLLTSTNFHVYVYPEYFGDYNYNAAEKEEAEKTPEEGEGEIHAIWFDNYDCGSSAQNAFEPTDFFKMLYHQYEQPTGPSYHKHDLDSYTSIYAGRAVGKVLKMQGKTGIAFKVDEPSTVTIVQAIARNSNTMPTADGTLLFYKQLNGEALSPSTDNKGITLLTPSEDLIESNNTYIENYTNQEEDKNEYSFYRLGVDNTTETDDYSATTTVYTSSFYDDQANTNTNTYENVRIYKIYVKTAGTYIIRNGGQYKPGINLKKEYTDKGAKKDAESGIAFIKVQAGNHVQDKVDDEIDWWQKEENPDYEDPEKKTEKQ